jgi:hypothetical protein
MAKPGPKSKTPNPEQLATIERLAGHGFRLDDIAIAVDISPSMLDRWMKRKDVNTAYRKGRIEAISNVAERLYQKALDGDVTAMIFYLKSQAQWTDKPQPEDNDRAEVVLYLPQNGR